MSRWFLDHVGLAEPYRFGRLLVVLSAVLLAIATGAALGFYRLIGELAFNTSRFWYFVYLLALLGLALVAARRPRYALVALSLATVELGLGVGSDILERHRYALEDLLPQNEPPLAARSWHPLLQEVVQPGAERRLRNDRIRHNSLGLRGPERSAEELRSRTVIVLFGGSTTEDIAVPDGQTWSDQLQRILGDRFAVINRGSDWYSTIQLVLLTAFYEQVHGVAPACAVYYIGGVDVRMSHFRGLDPGFADYHTLTMIDAVASRRVDTIVPQISPTLRYLGRLVVLVVDTVRPVRRLDGKAGDSPDPNLEAIYARNVRSISAINRQRGIKTVWIGETMDFARLAEGSESGEPWAPFVRSAAAEPLLSHLNGILKHEAMALGDVYIDLPAKDFGRDDFVDGEHFSEEGSLKFATLVAPRIGEACRP